MLVIPGLRRQHDRLDETRFDLDQGKFGAFRFPYRMLRTNSFAIVPGAAIILVAMGFLAFMRWQTGTGSLSSYGMAVEMPRADQLNVGTDVKIGGVTIGRITGISLKPRSYRVKIDMAIRTGIAIPQDSRPMVSGAVMGSPYLTIDPGRSTRTVPPGGNLIVK